MANLARTIKGMVAILIVVISFLFGQKSFALDIENFDIYTASSSVSAINESWASSTPTYSYVSTNTYASSSPQSAQLLNDTKFWLPDANIDNYFEYISYNFKFVDFSMGVSDKNFNYVFSIYGDEDGSDGHGELYFLVNGVYTTISSTLNDNQWYRLSIFWNNDTKTVEAKINNGSLVSSATSSLYVLPSFIVWSGIAAGSPLYIDDFNYEDNFGTVEIIDLPSNEANVSIIYDEDNPLNFRDENICYIDYGYCYLYFYAWPQNVGDTVYLYKESDPLNWIGSTVITNTGNYQSYIPLRLDLTELATTSQTILYGAFLDVDNNSFSTSDKFVNHIPITWRTLAEEEQNLLVLYQANDCEKFNIFSNDCDDISTTTIGYSLLCGIRLIPDFLFGVSTTTCVRYFDTIDKFSNSFPFNIITRIASTTTDNANSATSSAIIDIAPLKWWNGSEYANTGASLLTNKTFEQGMGSTLYNFYYVWFERLIYILMFGYIFYRVIRLVNPSFSGQWSFGPLHDRRDRYYKHRVEEYKAQKKFYDVQQTARGMIKNWNKK